MLPIEYDNVEHVNDLLEAINFSCNSAESIISLTKAAVEERDVKWIGSFGPGDLKDCNANLNLKREICYKVHQQQR